MKHKEEGNGEMETKWWKNFFYPFLVGVLIGSIIGSVLANLRIGHSQETFQEECQNGQRQIVARCKEVIDESFSKAGDIVEEYQKQVKKHCKCR